MDRTEFIKTLTILRTQPKSLKGFSLRRTIKTLHDYEQKKPILNYYKELIAGRNDGDDG
jgi:hypothetical protein